MKIVYIYTSGENKYEEINHNLENWPVAFARDIDLQFILIQQEDIDGHPFYIEHTRLDFYKEQAYSNIKWHNS